ncbi:aminoglycoside phosphotransferase family protein [Streptomyces tropicalis]|uniref:Aminoglycoside phosphotransferase family protein n=1 Tax=Streptomyces tropicalis TaxID=3034234 RepID=A0ABT6A7L3_9ACTN|nr:aminoglycoside phosphotransferase family protein [Streptomyces tropicalis]MDF3300351.1 aminoglycoside phosphotransferase family protein [Streptomyces tropicalis]
MGAPSLPRPTPGERARREMEAFVRLARQGRPTGGHHHRNHVVPLTEPVAALLGREPGTLVTVRIRRTDALPVVIRTWDDETRVLDAVAHVLPEAPRCLFAGDGFAVHSHVEGVPLSGPYPDGTPVDPLHVAALADLLARTTRVRRAALPPLPSGWPGHHADSQGFLRTLARLANQQIRQPNVAGFGGLFAQLGIPEDALTRLAARVPAMARRPFGLLHTDLHRDNLILSHGRVPPLTCVDWELATYGDPLHDLATHLVRMRYPAHQRDAVVDAWAAAVERVRPAAVNGLARDLRHYVAFERAQSVYPDVMRAATELARTQDQKNLDGATSRVHRALRAAAEPLGLADVPDGTEIERILFRWTASRTVVARGRPRGALAWTWDPRLPRRDDFPERAVSDALMAEGMAPAGRVFKGTAHLNSVVRVPGVDQPVVVRRRLARVCRREPSFLSEHAVLRAIERSGVPVHAPRALALGHSHRGQAFAIHTYVGPDDADRPPDHPVHGLLPHEADALVDQLCALADVDYRELDPVAGEEVFFTWLCDQLVLLVAGLPKESQQLARQLGLPDAERLRQILSRHGVGERSLALLHGDLNPWNLVRREGARGLTVIDWEMALVGDPLYDLVRHLHLTPNRPEIRERMFRRWERRMPARCTAGWQRDWRVYGWLETVRSAYVDLDRLVTRAGLDAPNVRRAVDSYATTLAVATGSLGLPVRSVAGAHPGRARA